MSEKNEENEDKGKPASNITVAKVALISAVTVAIIGAISAITGYYFNYLATRTQLELPATWTAEAQSTLAMLNTPTPETTLSTNNTSVPSQTPIPPTSIPPTDTPVPTSAPADTPILTPAPTDTPNLEATVQEKIRLTAEKQTQEAAIATLTAVASITPPLDLDTDGDGLRGSEEQTLGTSPTNPDTDGDGLSDGDEVNIYTTDPKHWDTDRDKIPDGYELMVLHTDPKNPPSCQPQLGGDGEDYIIARSGDPLEKIADKYLGDVFASTAIIYYTNLKNAGDNSYTKIIRVDSLEPGNKIYIPSPEEAQAYFDCQ